MAKVVYVFGSSLMHHGKRGQKWGVRNGPPYPLDQEGKERLRKQRMESYGKDKTGMSAFISQNENRRSAKTTVTFSDGHKQVFDLKEDALPGLRGIGRSPENARKDANWLRKGRENDPQFNNNCVAVTTSMADQMLGYYFSAGPNADGISNYAFEYYFDGTTREKIQHDNIKNSILSHGEGSFGALNFKTGADNGHATFWKVQNNDVNIYEAQDTEKFTKDYYSFDEYKSKVGIQPWDYTSIYDLTNAKPNMAHQSEDHVVFAMNINDQNRTFTQEEKDQFDSDTQKINFSTTWRTNDREYNGISKDNSTLGDLKRLYGVNI